jgi:hypothetical protein
VNKMDVQTIDLGHELRQSVEPRLSLSPVVITCPVPREFPHRRKLDPLRLIGHELSIRPACRDDAPPEAFKCLLREADAERADAPFCRHARSPGYFSLEIRPLGPPMNIQYPTHTLSQCE